MTENIRLYIDEHDEDSSFKDFIKHGSIETYQMYYFSVSNKRYYITLTREQIHALKYDHIKKKFYGLAHDFEKNVDKRVEVETSWVEKNFDEVFVEHAKAIATEVATYLQVVVGAENSDLQERITEVIDNNPLVKYRQKGINACAFASLSSAMYYLGFRKEAERLHYHQQRFFDPKSELFGRNASRIFPWIKETIKKDKEFFHHFHKLYEGRNINKKEKNYDLLNTPVRNDEIRWIVLWAADGSKNHAVAVVNNWIFDSNCTNALTLNQDNLDACCGSGSKYHGVSRGYHYAFIK